MSQKKNDKKDKAVETPKQDVREKEPQSPASNAKDPEPVSQPKPEPGIQEDRDVTIKESELQELRKKAGERDEFIALSQRIKADFSNYQKRMQKERETWNACAKEFVLKDILQVLDNFDLAIKCVAPTDPIECLLNGVQLTHKQFHTILDKHGVKPMEVAGVKFDPNMHEAVMLVDSDTDGIVIEEVRKGYTMNGRVLRPAQVKVSRKAQKPDETKTNS